MSHSLIGKLLRSCYLISRSYSTTLPTIGGRQGSTFKWQTIKTRWLGIYRQYYRYTNMTITIDFVDVVNDISLVDLIIDSLAKPKILQEIDLMQRDSIYCEALHKWATYEEIDFYQEGLICAGGDPDGGKDGCQGDSGSPLMVKNSAKNQVVQVGLMSGSPIEGCGTPNITSYYTRVSYYLKWIMDNLFE